MIKWRASIPKEPPEKGKVSAVIAFKSYSGARIEYVGTIDEEKMLEAWRLIVGSNKADSEKDQDR